MELSNKREKAIEFGQGFIEFLEKANAQVCSVLAIEEELVEAGFVELKMAAIWKVASNGKYYVKPFDTVIIAFTVGKDMHMLDRFKIIGSHVDSPCFKIKPNPEMRSDGYVKLNVEKYGGPILNTWLDRDLGISGIVLTKSDNPFKPVKHIIDLKELNLSMPNLAIHRNREVNKGFELNVQKHMLPILGQDTEDMKLTLKKVIADEIKVDEDDILDYELTVYINEPGKFVGYNKEFIKAPRIDNLAMSYASIKAMIEEESNMGVNVVVCFDNEEIGSNTKQGADSLLLDNILERIFMAYDKTKEQFLRVLPESFFMSADGATGTHPYFPEKHDPTNPCVPNKGIVIKLSSSKKYASDAETSAIFKQLCGEIGVETQNFVSRSDMLSGRTIGSMTESIIGVKGVDIGLPVLGMHSAHEHMGVDDFYDMYNIMKHFYTK